MAIEAEALRALSEKASQGEWLLRGRFISAPSTNPSIPGQDVVVSTGYSDRRVEQDEANVAFVAALVSAYRDGSLIHRSALAEDTARAAEGAPSYQERVAIVMGEITAGDPTDLTERRDRFEEEANEICQSLGQTRERAHELVDYTYGRPAGEPGKEIGSGILTLAALATEVGHDMMACAEADLAHVQKPETIARIRAKRSTRHGRGPLPGVALPLTKEAADANR